MLQIFNMRKLKEMFETVSPLLIKPKTTSITVSLSKRFFLFQLMEKTLKVIEDDPYLNFISLLKNYKILGRILTGTVDEFYRDRNKLYFKNFFMERKLYDLVKQDIEWLHEKHGHLRVTMTKRGLLIYDNYKKNQFNIMLLTVHSGTWMPKNVKQKNILTDEQRFLEEDVECHKLYSQLVLQCGGIWIDNKQSRFACDFNREFDRSIYRDKQEAWVDVLWKEQLSNKEEEELKQGHKEFYFTLARLTDSYRFNLIFDGHTMSDAPGRPNISFGTEYIPSFYMPIVKSMQQKLIKLGYAPVLFNTPYTGGYILEWLNQKAPDLFICSMEINKKIYMNKSRTKVHRRKVDRIAEDLVQISNISLEDEETPQREEPLAEADPIKQQENEEMEKKPVEAKP